MQTSIELDEELLGELARVRKLVNVSEDAVIRMALRAGLPLVTNRGPDHRPEGYFTDAYPMADDRLALESAMAVQPQPPDR